MEDLQGARLHREVLPRRQVRSGSQRRQSPRERQPQRQDARFLCGAVHPVRDQEPAEAGAQIP